MKRLFSLLLLLAGTASMLDAKVEPAPLFADNMVLQQNTDAAIWGKAEPDAKVTITTTWSKEKTVVHADSEGKWSARVATPAAGGPYEMTFNDGEKLTLKNILIGEVWICSGQSNMDMPMKGFHMQPTAGSAELILSAKTSTPIRSCNVHRAVSLKEEDTCGATWYEHTPEGVAEASATAYMFAKRLYETLDIPIGIIKVSWGGSMIHAWMDRDILETEFDGVFDMSAYETGALPETPHHQYSSMLYNGMLHSVAPYTAKGFIWYQGCSDIWQYERYKKLQTRFVKQLRDDWGDESMPFYFTQIAPYRYGNPDAPDAGFMMWAQAQTLDEIPNSGMAATHDTGEYSCIHPSNKKDVGNRLAYLALTRDYGIKGIDAETPIARSFEFKDGKAYVTFTAGEIGLSPIDSDLEGFELAGEDKVFHPAKARLDGDRYRIVVSCPEVSEPVAVRYGMKNWSEATLFNCFGIPASPFRSDNW